MIVSAPLIENRGMDLASIPLILSGPNNVAIPYLLILTFTLCMVYVLLRRHASKFSTYPMAAGIYGVIAICAAAVFQTNIFHALQLIAYALFAGLPVLLFMCGWFARVQFKKVAVASFSMAILISMVGIDAFFIEPHSLQVTHYTMTSSKLAAPLRIAVASDVQSDNYGPYELNAFSQIAAAKPDLFLMPGDYIQTWTPELRAIQASKLQEILNEANIRPRLGAYAVQGDSEPYANWPEIFHGTVVKPYVKTTTFEDGPIDVTALSFDNSCDTKLRVAKTDKFHVVFGHRPDFALGDVQGDLLVAGHTHGGQVQLPFFGPLLKLTKVPTSWAKGNMVKIDKDRTVMVTRGVGLERMYAPRLRFLCRPEVVIIDVLPQLSSTSQKAKSDQRHS